MFKFKKDQFSEFSKLGDLRNYKLDEISSLIKNLKKVERVEGSINYVTWSNEFYEFVIEYDLQGNFIRINSEDWLDSDQNIIIKLRHAQK